MKTRLAPVVLAAWLLGGCASGVPSCADGDVGRRVDELSAKEITRQLFVGLLAQKAGAYPASVLGRIPVDTWKSNPPTAQALGVANFSYDVNDVLAILAEAEKQGREAAPTLRSTRTIENGEHTVRCGGDLVFPNGRRLPITYSAARTDGDGLHVEVQGL
jgi:hypothetical protein